MTTRALSDMTLAKAKRFALIGAVVLWVLCPVVIGGWITVAVHLGGRDHVGVLTYVGMIVGALVCLALVVAGFAFLLGGVFFWWRSSNPGKRPHDPVRSATRAELLRQLHEQVRAEREQDAAATDAHPAESSSLEGRSRV